MKRPFHILAVACLSLATQCSQPAPTEFSQPAATAEESYAITPAEAASEALNARAALTPATRSEAVCVQSVQRLEAQAAAADAQIDPSVYLVNFADGKGFAVVGADRRQTATLYAISDEGTFPDPHTTAGPAATMYARIEALAASDKITPSGVIYGPWENTAKVDPMVKVRWGRGNPYNCSSTLTTAMAQVMSYHKRPWQYLWSEITKHISTKGTAAENYPPAYTEISALFARIDAAPYDAAIDMGYNAVNMIFNYANMKGKIDEGKPIIIETGPGYVDPTDRWVVDGYLEQIRYAQKDPTSAIKYLPQRRQLVHCNMCCDGIGNGYYLSTLLDMSEPKIPDSGMPAGGVDVSSDNPVITVIWPYEGKQKW